jgi:hypothetical protein
MKRKIYNNKIKNKILFYRSSNLSLTSRRAFRRRPASRNTSLLTKLFSKLISTVYLEQNDYFSFINKKKTINSLPSSH